MAKQTVPSVAFSKTDSPSPKKMPGGFIGLRAPFPATLKPQATMYIDFNMKCDTPLLIVGSRLEMIGGIVFASNRNIKVQVRNPSLTEDVVFDIGESVLLAYPLLPSEYSVE